MAGNSHTLSLGASTLNILNKSDLGTMMSAIPIIDDTEADTLNDETFGDCDLDAIKIKSDFGENGEFLGDNLSERLPDFFDTGDDNDDQSQQPSIDALLGENQLRMPTTTSVNLRQSTMNPLFNMAISQARDTNHENIFLEQQNPRSLPQKQQINYQVLKQFEQMLISRQVPPQQRIVYIQAMVEKMQRDGLNAQQQATQVKYLIMF
jgi:hypothetical protein